MLLLSNVDVVDESTCTLIMLYINFLDNDTG